MNKIIIYSKGYCPFCVKAKEFFQIKGLEYQEIDIGVSEELQQEMLKKSNGRKTVPQIFINNHHIGGYDDLIAASDECKLEKYLTE